MRKPRYVPEHQPIRQLMGYELWIDRSDCAPGLNEVELLADKVIISKETSYRIRPAAHGDPYVTRAFVAPMALVENIRAAPKRLRDDG